MKDLLSDWQVINVIEKKKELYNLIKLDLLLKKKILYFLKLVPKQEKGLMIYFKKLEKKLQKIWKRIILKKGVIIDDIKVKLINTFLFLYFFNSIEINFY